MLLSGLQKMTLLDFPGHVACTVFTYGCNLRCPFCHNASLVTQKQEDTISEETFFEFLNKRKGVLDGVCITGGEPLLQNGIEKFIKKIKELGFMVKLDTNGCFPEKLISLCENKLIDYVAMDIKNSEQSYAKTVGVSDFDFTPVKRSIEYLLSGKTPYEFRTTVVKGFFTHDDFVSIADMLAGAEKYFLQNFVDSGNLIMPGLTGHDKAEMEEFAAIVRKKIPSVAIRGI